MYSVLCQQTCTAAIKVQLLQHLLGLLGSRFSLSSYFTWRFIHNAFRFYLFIFLNIHVFDYESFAFLILVILISLSLNDSLKALLRLTDSLIYKLYMIFLLLSSYLFSIFPIIFSIFLHLTFYGFNLVSASICFVGSPYYYFLESLNIPTICFWISVLRVRPIY